MAEPMFREQDLREMEKRTVDRLQEAIDSGDRDGATKIAWRMVNEFEAMHDLYRDWAAATLSSVGRRFGDGGLEEVMKDGVEAWWGRTRDGGPRDRRTRAPFCRDRTRARPQTGTLPLPDLQRPGGDPGAHYYERLGRKKPSS